MNTHEKILTSEALKERLAEDRHQGRKVVLTNGCFDLLHVGHVRFLDGARREGDVLVVAINSDESERRLKGEGRPILPAEVRAELVAAVAAVDYVVIFEEPDVARLLEALRPDVHAKGTDYTAETVPEREWSRRLDIRVAIVGDPKQHSSKDLIAQVRQATDG